MTGTMEFMTIDVLRGVEHIYRHDLESFFYVLLWICARRTWEMKFEWSIRDRSERNILRKWYGNNTVDVADAKQGFMHADGFKSILEEFAPAFDHVKSLCRKLRSILFSLIKDGELDLETSTDSDILYNPVLKSFGDVISPDTDS